MPEGGVNVCYGIQVYGKECKKEGIIEGEKSGIIKGMVVGTIHTLQRHGFSIAETIKDVMDEYQLVEKEAKEIVEENWKKN